MKSEDAESLTLKAVTKSCCKIIVFNKIKCAKLNLINNLFNNTVCGANNMLIIIIYNNNMLHATA